ncbi:MAG: hypothetical protein IIC00_12290 [Planctomycetes bacterium]|nr:hypothetical protein [Planctomycetota bacterium]
MEFSRRIIVVLVMAVVATVIVLPSSAEEKKDEKNIWTEGESRGPGRGPGPGRGSRRFELTDEEIDRVMKGLKESNPEKAKELAKLREKEPEKFRDELRRHGREEFGKIIRERIDNWRKRRRAEFLESLEKLVPKEARELAKLKDTNPDLYAEKYELILRKYGRIIEEGRRNPELAEVLIEDLKLKKRRDELLKKIKAVKSENEKKKLVAELEEVVAGRFDLIVRRKQIAYERLLRWLEGLQKRIRESRGEIVRWRDEKLKNENVKQRTGDLLEEIPKFNWD